MIKKFGFTLAEVLITLGIIGVVAAMTMPTLINATNGAQYKTAYKKALSVLNQAVALNMALDDYDFNTANTGTGTDDTSIYNIIMNRMNVMNVHATTGWMGYSVDIAATTTGNVGDADLTQKFDGTGHFSMFFNDGIAFMFPTTASQCVYSVQQGTANCVGFIDVNGRKGPNMQTVCDKDTGGGTGVECVVSSPRDVYPVYFGSGTVTPSTPAGKTVLFGK